MANNPVISGLRGISGAPELITFPPQFPRMIF
jgi:hypothetical protein